MSRLTLAITSPTPDQTHFVGHCLGRLLRPGDILALEGRLGAGKTCLVRGIAAGMGLDTSPVCSPTFVIVNEYSRSATTPSSSSTLTPLVHADAYRLHGPEDLDALGWDRLADGTSVVVIEWASRIRDALTDLHALALIELEPIAATQPPSPAADPDAAPALPRLLTMNLPAAWSLRREWPGLAGLADPPTSATAHSPARTPTRCRVCARDVAPSCPTWPFDSARCRDADLGRWLSGVYAIGGTHTGNNLGDEAV